MKKYDSFIFDLDGTLCDTLLDIAECINYSLTYHKLKNHTYEEYKGFIGYGSKYLIEHSIEPHKELFDSVFKVYLDKYNLNPCKNTLPYPHVKEFLTKAKNKNIKLFVFTNKPQILANQVIETCFGNDIFDEIVGTTKESKVVKPNISYFTSVVKKHNIDYSSSAYFGDSDVDILTATNLNVNEIFSVLWGYQDITKLEKVKTSKTKFLKNGEELLNII